MTKNTKNNLKILLFILAGNLITVGITRIFPSFGPFMTGVWIALSAILYFPSKSIWRH